MPLKSVHKSRKIFRAFYNEIFIRRAFDPENENDSEKSKANPETTLDLICITKKLQSH
jgi:hypothetical protein